MVQPLVLVRLGLNQTRSLSCYTDPVTMTLCTKSENIMCSGILCDLFRCVQTAKRTGSSFKNFDMFLHFVLGYEIF
ncbi:hypothetical protein L1987_32989 [Smallanthus sonchifolius]|uniref:Uncharacterized protein n=1 Tax=Smallanthus sonchifolius TaxID=185202 RepID=A0ACB9HR64_9ASTR|nr:hypothetical protein L1987_32989 [Smallanthus sonchifolius]